MVDGTFRWRLGVRPLRLRDWFQFGPDADGPDGWIAQKAEVLAAHHAQVFVAGDDVEPESMEVAQAVVDHLATHHPDHRVDLDPALHPLEAASRLVPEDLIVTVERDGRRVFGGGCVCFPNRWDLPSKLGCTMAEVHAPVARLNEQLESGVDRFLDRLEPERSFWRLGWGVIDTADGYTPTAHRAIAGVEPEMFVRVERETLSRFPRTNAVLFTIRTYIAPIASVAGDPESAAALAASVAAMTTDVHGYKDLADSGDAIVSSLLAAAQDR